MFHFIHGRYRKTFTIWYIFKSYIWWRYIEDKFLIREHGEESLELFLKEINSIQPTIKFTADLSYRSVTFLEVKVILKEGKIIIDFYVKATEIYQYLNSSLCYHKGGRWVYRWVSICFKKSCKESIPESQALRLNRICSNSAFLVQGCNELEHWF